MNVNDEARQWCFEHPGQIIAASVPQKDRYKNQHSYAGKKEILEAALVLAYYTGCHGSSKRSGLSLVHFWPIP